MKLNNLEINILINGRKATEYQSPMDFQNYIEGRDGSEFEIEFVNNNSFDVEAILSVDGRSITDGKLAGSSSSGYVVNANSRTRIPGWMVDGDTAARFTFSGKKGGSYDEQMGGDGANKGVIGAKVYARKSRPQSFGVMRNGVMRCAGIPKGGFANGYVGGTTTAGYPTLGSGLFDDSAYTVDVSCMVQSAMSASASTDERTRGLTTEVEQTLGTEFGAATDFNTTEVEFERGDITGVIVLYYDDRQGLKRRGIDVTQKQKRPSAFPADEVGCPTPEGWSK